MIKERKIYIDVARGIGILLVIIGHVVLGGGYPMQGAEMICNFIYSFHMPLFFIISGLCIKESKQLNQETLKKMAYSYLVPYVIWTIVYLGLFQALAFVEGRGLIFRLNNAKFAHAISNCGLAPLWFLWALFFAEFIVVLIKSHVQKGGGVLHCCINDSYNYFNVSVL